jgi:hypothetical protein
MLSAEEKQSMLNKYVWHHSIDFGDGVISPGGMSLHLTEAFAHTLVGASTSKGSLFWI